MLGKKKFISKNTEYKKDRNQPVFVVVPVKLARFVIVRGKSALKTGQSLIRCYVFPNDYRSLQNCVDQ